MIRIGETIKDLRQKQGITQEALAWQLGVTPQAVSRWENQQSLPDIAMLPAIAGLFGVTIDSLLAYNPDEIKNDVFAIQQEFYKHMDSEPDTAAQILRDGLQKYPGNEDLLLDSLYLLRGPEHYEERVALCQRLRKSTRPEVSFRASHVLAKSYHAQGLDLLAKELLDTMSEFDYTTLEIRAMLLSGEESFEAAQREKNASLSRLLEMLHVLALRYREQGQQKEAKAMAQIALDVLEAFRTDVPYRFPSNDTKTQTYEAFQKEKTVFPMLLDKL